MAPDFEHSKRKVRIIKAANAYRIFKELICYNAAKLIINSFNNNGQTFEEMINSLPLKTALTKWKNIGGQLILETEITKLVDASEPANANHGMIFIASTFNKEKNTINIDWHMHWRLISWCLKPLSIK